jgi:hypothetical protein
VRARLVEGDVGQGGSRARRGGRIATEGEKIFSPHRRGMGQVVGWAERMGLDGKKGWPESYWAGLG